MTPDEKIARQIGKSEVRIVVRHFVRRPRAAVGVAIVLATFILVAVAVLPLLGVESGVIGFSEVAAAVSSGVTAGVVAALGCILVWRHRDFPRRNKLAPQELWLTERYLVSIGDTRERASSSGANPRDAVMTVVLATSPGERARVLPVVRDLIPRQVVAIVCVGVGVAIVVPLVLLGVFGHAPIWSLFIVLVSPGLGVFLIPKQIEAVGHYVQVREWLTDASDADSDARPDVRPDANPAPDATP